jgi:ankyrin repeat protein
MDNVLGCYSDDIQDVLNDLPKDLDETYERTLRNIDDQKRKYAQRLFQCLLVCIRPLRVEELAAILPGRFDGTAPTSFKKVSRPLDAKRLVLSACASLISIINQGGSEIVQFAHFSVKEYLTSERLAAAEEHLSFYHILPEPAHTILAQSSLSVLLLDEIDRDTMAHFPLAPYAAQHWVDHAQFGNVSSHIEEVMKRLFDPAKPHFAAWVWLYDIDRYWTEHMPTMRPTQPEAVPLYYASLCGFVGLTEHLIAAHPRNVNRKGGSHTTALHAASVKGHLKVASLLLKNGADPDSRDDLGRVPLHRISQGGHMMESSLEIGRLLVNSGANVNITDDEGCAPLHAAAQSGYREIAELLLESNASLDARNNKQETPLKLSCRSGKLEMARFLIDRGSDINSRNENDLIPLHSASRWGHVDVARLLLDCGSDMSARSSQSWTALHFASRYGYLDLARLLIDHGADVDAQEEDLWTPLHLASHDGRLDIAKLLIDRGANVDSWNDKQETPLALASIYGYLDMARFLIEKGAVVSVPDKEGDTPLVDVT